MAAPRRSVPAVGVLARGILRSVEGIPMTQRRTIGKSAEIQPNGTRKLASIIHPFDRQFCVRFRRARRGDHAAQRRRRPGRTRGPSRGAAVASLLFWNLLIKF
jgi:hypothetical protein